MAGYVVHHEDVSWMEQDGAGFACSFAWPNIPLGDIQWTYNFDG